MAKRRCDMTADELEAARERDRIYWHERRKTDAAYMERHRADQRRQKKEWYADPKNALAMSIYGRMKFQRMKTQQPERYAAYLEQHAYAKRDRYWECRTPNPHERRGRPRKYK